MKRTVKGTTGTVSHEFIDLWTEVRDWTLRPVCRLKIALRQIWRIGLKKRISQLQPELNVEILNV